MHSISLTAAWSSFPVTEESRGWARWFGEPTNVASPEQVWLVAEGVEQRRLWLNGDRLTEEATTRSPVLVTGRLQRRNLLLLLPAEVDAGAARNWTSALMEGRCEVTRQSLPRELTRVALLIGKELVDFPTSPDR